MSEYEIHITVNCDNIQKFKDDCLELGVKPIVIETEREGEYLNQVMTSSKHKDVDQIQILNLLKDKLIEKGYEILRLKVEIYPDEIKSTNFIYYESHLRLKLPKGFDRSILTEICKEWDVHLSRNLFKRDENFDYQMITYRNREIEFHDFNDIIQSIKNGLDEIGIVYDKVEIEECIYDSNTAIDNSWLNVDNFKLYSKEQEEKIERLRKEAASQQCHNPESKPSKPLVVGDRVKLTVKGQDMVGYILKVIERSETYKRKNSITKREFVISTPYGIMRDYDSISRRYYKDLSHVVIPEKLKKVNTGELLAEFRARRHGGYHSSSHYDGVTWTYDRLKEYTDDEIRAELRTRPNIKSKRGSKIARKKKALNK